MASLGSHFSHGETGSKLFSRLIARIQSPSETTTALTKCLSPSDTHSGCTRLSGITARCLLESAYTH